MKYPEKMQIGGNIIPVEVLAEPVRQVGPHSYVIGEYHPLTRAMKIYHTNNNIRMCGENFVHETIEAINALYDLNLSHQTITTLATALYQAYSTGNVNFCEEVEDTTCTDTTQQNSLPVQ